MNKKIVNLLSFFLFLSCTNQTSENVNQWETVGKLPVPQGFEESIGVAAAYAEFIGDYLVVAGGANFPYELLVDGGKKEFYNDIFVFEINEDNTLKQIGSGMLPKKLAGGASIIVGEEMYIIGGENIDGESDSIYLITLKGATPVVSEVARLPFTWAMGAAVMQDNILYLFAGRNNKKAVSRTWAFNMDTKAIKELTPMPAEARVQMPYVTKDRKVYIFNGLGNLTLIDNYVYDIASDTWTQLSDTKLNNKGFTVAGGAAILLAEDSILVLGGVNQGIFDNALTQMRSLQGEELKVFNKQYQSMSPEEFKFSREKMVYNISQNKWTSLGKLPFNGGAGPFPLLRKGNTVWHISGEIKAGVRQPEIRVGLIQ